MSSFTFESVANHLTLIKESDVRLKVLGLQKLAPLVHYHWHEISDHLGAIQALHEDDHFPERTLAASIISKVFYHLEDYNEAVNYALESGNYFDLNVRDQYTDVLVGKCIDRYISLRQQYFESKNPAEIEPISTRLESVVEEIFKRSVSDKEFNLGLGVALDSRRTDKIEEILRAEGYSSEFLGYLTKTILNSIKSRNFRIEALKIVVKAFGQRQKNNSDYINLAQALFLLGEHKTCADLLFEMIRYEDDEKECLAYQIASDLNENENTFFLNNVVKELNKIENPSQHIAKARDNVTKILKGSFKAESQLRFYKLNNQSDPAIIANLKQTIDSKNSVAHGGCLLANSLLNAHTTDDNFLRNNLEWVAKANLWSKFSATASLGTIHQGNNSKAMEILNPYFPGALATPSWYTHGGSLYALGLIHAGDRNQDVITFILNAIKNPVYNANESLIHGAALGLGLVNLGSCDEEDNLVIYEELKNILFTDSATTGEAAGLAIGLTMIGSANQLVIQDLLGYAHETQHEKIIRSIALALALIMYSKEESADALIDQLCTDKDPIIRFGGMHMIGLAYVATASNAALKKLLHFAVSDVSNDVRRAAVTNIGFLMLKDSSQVPKIVHLLSASFNPHVRYGACLALGISSAGSCNAEALNLIEPMLKDAVDFVRQGAFIATAMILQQATATQEPKVEAFKKTLDEHVAKKHEDSLVRLGVLLSIGILEAGGRNANTSLVSQFGYPKLAACAGMTIFTHFWYWFPSVHFFSLTLSPAGLIGVNKNLRIPKGFQFKTNAKPSLFDYPPHIKPDDKKKLVKKETVQLSITNKAKARAEKKKHADKEEEAESPGKKDKIEEETKEKEEEKKKDEPPFKICDNHSRVLLKQMEYISFLSDNRYTPVLKNRKRGLIFLIDKKAGEKEEFIDTFGDPVEAHLVPPEEFVFDEEANLIEK